MKNLESFFTNPFSDPRISRDRKKKFGEETISRIAKQNTGNLLDQALTDTIAAQTALFGDITSVDTNEAIREARTQSVDNVIALFSTRNTRLNAYFTSTGFNKTPGYQEFFPQGVQPFTSLLTKGNVEQRMTEMITAVTNNLADAGGATTLEDYNQLLITYKKARGQQLTKKADVAAGRSATQQAELDWDDQMFENLLLFANMNRDEPENLKLYMDQSILQTAVSSDKDGKGRLAGIITKNGLPTSGIKLHVVDGGINDETTAADGSYSTQYLPVGTADVELSENGLLLKTVNVIIKDEGDTAGDFVV